MHEAMQAVSLAASSAEFLCGSAGRNIFSLLFPSLFLQTEKSIESVQVQKRFERLRNMFATNEESIEYPSTNNSRGD